MLRPTLVMMLLSLSGCSLLFEAEQVDKVEPAEDAGGAGFTPSNGVQLPAAGELEPLELTSGQYLVLTSEENMPFIFLCTEDVTCEPVLVDGLELRIVQGRYLLAEMESLNIDQDSFLVGAGPLPLILAVATDITIDGNISVASFYDEGEADPFFLGAGGYSGGESGLPGQAPETCGSAMNSQCEAAASGAGGAHAQLGGGAPGGAGGGQIYGDPNLIPLVGGGGGGGGGAEPDARADGGGGGGAVQISAGGSIIVRGGISARGGGGLGAESVVAATGDGGGGGAGGAVLLEAPVVTISGTAQVSVHGGPGASGNCSAPEAPGTDGADEVFAEAPEGCSGDGGAGGGRGSDQNGKLGEPAGGNGGGGGSYGRIRVNFADYADGHPAFNGLYPANAVTTGPLAK